MHVLGGRRCLPAWASIRQVGTADSPGTVEDLDAGQPPRVPETADKEDFPATRDRRVIPAWLGSNSLPVSRRRADSQCRAGSSRPFEVACLFRIVAKDSQPADTPTGLATLVDIRTATRTAATIATGDTAGGPVATRILTSTPTHT